MNGSPGNPMCESVPSVDLIIGIKRECQKCKTPRELADYSKNSARKDGLQVWCKQCVADYNDGYDKKRKSRSARKWRQKNKEEFRVMVQAWRKKNPAKIHACNERSDRKRRSTAEGQLSRNMTTSIGRSLHRKKAGRSWEALLGFSVAQLRKHLEKRFTPEMSWENYGTYWHVDHKIPISVFNYQTPEDADFKRCWALKNLQPLEAKQNISKHNKLEKPFQPSLAMPM